jgi:hypothetical protein
MCRCNDVVTVYEFFLIQAKSNFERLNLARPKLCANLVLPGLFLKPTGSSKPTLCQTNVKKLPSSP